MATPEKVSLLCHKQKMSIDTQCRSMKARSSEEWYDGSSSDTSSSYSGSYSDDSYIASWENFVCDGVLFYAEYTDLNTTKCSLVAESGKTSETRSPNRQNSKKTTELPQLFNKKVKKGVDRSDNLYRTAEGSKSISGEDNLGEINEIQIHINPDLVKHGRKLTTESLLGLCTSTFSDGKRLVLSGFIKKSELSQNKSIRIGHWLKSINNAEVTKQNIGNILSQFTRPTNVTLKFQSIVCEGELSGVGKNVNRRITNFRDFSEFSKSLLITSDLTATMPIDTSLPFSLMLLTLDFSDADIEANDVLFCYPPTESNALFSSRGSFLTLNSILKSELNTDPVASTVMANDHIYNISYLSYDKVLILFAISNEYSSLKETRFRTNELMQYLQFCYLSLNIPLQENIKSELRHVCEILECRLLKRRGIPQFEKLLQESQLVSLPKEAQLRIFDALSEIEAMDYRDWNEEPLNSHREFFIFGTALYFKSYLLATHLPVSQLTGIETFLRHRGIFDFIEAQNVRDLVIWTEIPMMASNSRYFLAIVSRNQLLLCVVLQTFESHKINEDEKTLGKVIEPSLFYIEEIQDTLDHLRHGGIEALARTWITSNKRPEIVKNPIESKPTVKRTEFISILKNRSLSYDDVRASSSIGGSSVHSLTHSEDSNQKLNEDDSDSDWDGFLDSHKSSSGFDMSEIKDSFLKEICDVIPTRITTGRENVLFHYVHLDTGTGIVLAPPEGSTGLILNIFRNACHLIHTVLQNTKKFRRLLALENTKSLTPKSLVAIKEHGILLSVTDNVGNQSNFWAIGRLFTAPTRELYVCHRSDVPQNLVEIAFRLSFYSTS